MRLCSIPQHLAIFVKRTARFKDVCLSGIEIVSRTWEWSFNSDSIKWQVTVSFQSCAIEDHKSHVNVKNRTVAYGRSGDRRPRWWRGRRILPKMFCSLVPVEDVPYVSFFHVVPPFSLLSNLNVACRTEIQSNSIKLRVRVRLFKIALPKC